MRKVLVAPLLVLIVAGCGGGHAPKSAKPRHPLVATRTCTGQRQGLRICSTDNLRNQHSTIERRSGSQWRVVARPLGREDGGEWISAYLSPDRKTILAEWDFPCDSHVALFIPSRGGKARVVTGELDWRRVVPSDEVARGWTADGKARVRRNDGLHLIDPKTVSPHRSAAPSGC